MHLLPNLVAHVGNMLSTHDNAGKRLRKIPALCLQYIPPDVNIIDKRFSKMAVKAKMGNHYIGAVNDNGTSHGIGE